MRFPHSLTTAMSVAIALGWFAGVGRLPRAIAQLSACAPPRAGEFLLLVLPENNDDLAVVSNLLPSQVQAQPCTYLDEVVLRIQGFDGQEDASALARRITQESGLNAFVTRPPSNGNGSTASSRPTSTSSGSLNLPQVQVIEGRSAGERPRRSSQDEAEASQRPSRQRRRDNASAQTATDNRDEGNDLDISLGDLPPANLPDGSFDVPSPDTNPEDLPVYVPVEEETTPPSTSPQGDRQPMPEVAIATPPRSSGYNPQPLEEGYAVLVDYFNQPQVARQVQGVTNRTVGLVSYGQRPYLLVGYSRDETEANALLQRLSEQGFWTMVVDSQRVMLLTPQVSLN